jgi:1-acyl-sn-glycerol-3-phosphate acyltransferase
VASRQARQAEPPYDPRALRELIPPPDTSREVDDWGRSERVFQLMEPLLNFYYRYWFRVDAQGVENIPSAGGALLVSNHSGALPPDAPMIMQAIRNEHPDGRDRPLYMLGEHWFKGYPGVGMLANKIGLVAAHPANAQRLLADEGRLALVFPEGQKGSRKLYWQRYKLRRFGRGGFIKTALRAQVPIVPVAVIGAEEAMPIFAHVKPLQKLTGLIYFPINHAFPHFGLAAGAMYMPAKFKIRFLEPVSLDAYGPEDAEDLGLVQGLAEQIRLRIQREVDRLVATRSSVWFG